MQIVQSFLDYAWYFVTLPLSVFPFTSTVTPPPQSHERRDSNDSVLSVDKQDLHRRIASALATEIYQEPEEIPLSDDSLPSLGEPLPVESLARPTSIFILAPEAPQKCLYIEPDLPSPYDRRNAWHDIPGVAYVLELFLSGRMEEAENWCKKIDPKMERMHISMALGCIQCLKGLMSFANEDLLQAVNSSKHSSLVASQHRKKPPSLWASFSDWAIPHYSSMTPSQLHAELVYAESLFMKSLLNIALAGDLIAFVKELVNVKACIGIYRSLGRYIEHVDNSIPDGIDPHLRSGTYLGLGIIYIVLSMMPQRLLSVIELFGFKGDKQAGLDLLGRCGGWKSSLHQPSIPPEQEGCRRPIADLAIIVFHTLSPSFLTACIDLPLAEAMLKWNSDRYQNGPFHQILQGELEMKRSRPAEAIAALQSVCSMASSPNPGFRNLSYMATTETAIALIALGSFSPSEPCWRTLRQNATWSKAIYTYGLAVCLLSFAPSKDSRLQEIKDLLAEVPSLKQKIGGRSIPMEKYVAYKSTCLLKDPDLALGDNLPIAEMAYFMNAFEHSPPSDLAANILPLIRACQRSQGEGTEREILRKFLEAVCLRFVAYPTPFTMLSLRCKALVAKEQATLAAQSKDIFEWILQPNVMRLIDANDWVVYWAHYELGALLLCLGKVKEGKKHFDLVYSGKQLVPPPSGRTGKYVMESALNIRVSAAIDSCR